MKRMRDCTSAKYGTTITTDAPLDMDELLVWNEEVAVHLAPNQIIGTTLFWLYTGTMI